MGIPVNQGLCTFSVQPQLGLHLDLFTIFPWFRRGPKMFILIFGSFLGPAWADLLHSFPENCELSSFLSAFAMPGNRLLPTTSSPCLPFLSFSLLNCGSAYARMSSCEPTVSVDHIFLSPLRSRRCDKQLARPLLVCLAVLQLHFSFHPTPIRAIMARPRRHVLIDHWSLS